MKTTLKPEMLKWARKRAGLSELELASKVGIKEPGAVAEWEKTGLIDFGKVEKIARATFTPLGYLFLQQPPVESLPIKDFRTIGSEPNPAITPNLLDVIYAAQRRQSWYRDYLIEMGNGPLPFVGMVTTDTDEKVAAAKIVSVFQIGPPLSGKATSWQHNLSLHIDALEENGVLVMRSGVVGNSNKRKLSVKDFRGFALCDNYAPVVFINSQDYAVAQIFTLVHELVHICIAESAVFNLNNTYSGNQSIELYCNRVAAEILVPIQNVIKNWNKSADPVSEIRKISRIYRVSTAVAARRVLDAGFITRDQFDAFYNEEAIRLQPKRDEDSSGNFYNTMNARVSGRIAQALVASTLGGKTLYGEAMHLLGIKNSKVIQTLGQKFGYSNQ